MWNFFITSFLGQQLPCSSLESFACNVCPSLALLLEQNEDHLQQGEYLFEEYILLFLLDCLWLAIFPLTFLHMQNASLPE
jgi:hypothetical protein